ncbi:MAG: hypothetical protein U5Q44_04905 [Dehalococcoidia bacterium]|nr:hypothetical protein [Dehalococcoidia bacterium]
MTTQLDGLFDTADEGEAPRPRRKTIIRTGTLVLWGLVMLFVIANAIRNPSTTNVVTAVGFVALFAIVQVQFFVVRWAGRRHFKRLEGKLRGSGYISELDGLPNRNYLLAELRREMPRARAEETPFTVVVFDIATLAESANVAARTSPTGRCTRWWRHSGGRPGTRTSWRTLVERVSACCWWNAR